MTYFLLYLGIALWYSVKLLNKQLYMIAHVRKGNSGLYSLNMVKGNVGVFKFTFVSEGVKSYVFSAMTTHVPINSNGGRR